MCSVFSFCYFIPHAFSLAYLQCDGIECDVLFGNIDEVCQMSEELLAAMEEEREQIGSVFVRMSKELLEVYTIYCKNYNLATLALRKVCTHALPHNHMHPRSHTLILYSSCLCYSLYCIVIIHGSPQQHLLVYVTVVGWILPVLLYCIL